MRIFNTLSDVFASDIKRAGGIAKWRIENYEARKERERTRDLELIHEEDRRMRALEAKHERREYKRRNSASETEQMRFRL